MTSNSIASLFAYTAKTTRYTITMHYAHHATLHYSTTCCINYVTAHQSTATYITSHQITSYYITATYNTSDHLKANHSTSDSITLRRYVELHPSDFVTLHYYTT